MLRKKIFRQMKPGSGLKYLMNTGHLKYNQETLDAYKVVVDNVLAARNLLIRICQFAIMYVLVVCGCVVFENHHTYVDFAPSILMLGFGTLAFDLWFASYGIITAIIAFTKKHIHKK